MAGGRMCSNCKQVHEGNRGSKCTFLTHPQDYSSDQEGGANAHPENISQAQAEATANQVLVGESSNSSASNSTNSSEHPAMQDPILKQLLNISERFGLMEQQAAKDRQNLTGLVSEFGKQGESVRQLLASATTSQNSQIPNTSSQASRSNRAQSRNVDNSNSSLFSSNVNPQSVGSGISTDNVSEISHRGVIQASNSHTQNVASDRDSGHHLGDYGMDLPNTRARGRDGRSGNEVRTHNATSALSFNTGQSGNGRHRHVSTSHTQGRTVNQHSQQGEAEPHIIPSIQALRQTSDIHNRVNRRYQELEDDSSFQDPGNLDFLIETLQKRAQKQEKYKVKWPQEMAFIGTQ